jgi:O-antigen ligase
LVAQFLSITLLFTQTYWCVARSEGRQSRLAVVAFGVGVLCLALTLTRSSWIAFTLGSTVLGAYWVRRGVLKLQTITAVLLVVALAVAVAWPAVSVRLQQDHKAAAEERENLLYIGFEMVKAHPLIGIGINTSRDRLNDFVPGWFTAQDWVYVPHNQYLIVAEETGLIGLLAFLWLLWTGASAAVRSARADDPVVARMGMTLVACFVVMIWAMNIDFYGGTQMYVILWVLLGFACGLEELREREIPGRVSAATPLSPKGLA